MLEQAYTFGNSAQLVGIYTNANRNTQQKQLPTVLLLNSGLLHRPGPFRLHVDLARKLADLGFPVFRFDISGIGDSEKHHGKHPREEQVLSDIKEAMDAIASRKGALQFVAMGLCTGADNAHKILVQDKRVIGAVFLDGYCYPTFGFYLRKYGVKLLSPGLYLRNIKRSIRQPKANRDNRNVPKDNREENYFWKLPDKNKTETELTALVSRGVHLLYIYTGANNFVNYQGQLADSMKSINFNQHLQEAYLEEAEHTYPIIADRKRMMSIIYDWMLQHYSS